MDIKQASVNDADKLAVFLGSLREKQDKVTPQEAEWINYLPARNQILEKISNGEEFYAEEKGMVLGIITLANENKGYAGINWEIKDGRPVYITWLIVDPTKKDGGVERQLMLFAEEMVRKKSAACIRLDAFSTGIRSPEYYQELGYKQVGEVKLPSKDKSFICYEKGLK